MEESASPQLSATFRFYADLNFFLPPRKRQRILIYPFTVSTTVKDVIESLGIPHPEVELILANGHSVDFGYLVRDGDHLAIYPHFRSLDVSALSRVKPPPLAEPRFILDVHLGRLAAYLRMFGFDTLYRNDYEDEELAEIASREQRILLTRDRGLLKRSIVTYGYCLRYTNPRQQLIEVLQRFNLFDVIKPFHRCLHCNSPLRAVAKTAILDRLPPQTERYYDDFHYCPGCDRVYWQGTHYNRMQQFIDQILAEHGGAG